MQYLTVYGRHNAQHLLKSPFVSIEQVFCTEEAWFSLKELGYNKSLCKIQPISYFPKDVKHQGIEIRLYLKVFSSIEECLSEDWKSILLLERLSDPMNVGSLIRHAVAFGVDAVCLSKHHSCPLTTTVAQASSGAIFEIPLIQAPAFNQQLREIKELGFGLIGTSLKPQSVPFSQKVFWPKSAFIIGEEGFGLSQGVENLCDQLVYFEMSGKIQSLNAAVSGALICYERYQDLKNRSN